MLNGCYPWNRNPLMLCGLLGGLLPVVQVRKGLEPIPRECVDYKAVTEQTWLGHLSDLKRMAKLNEESRRWAMQGEVRSSELLPAESVNKHQ
jgi:hypothetical protein